MLIHMLNPRQAEMNDLSSMIEAWDYMIQDYERRKDSSGARGPLDDDIKASVLQGMAPEQLQTFLHLRSTTITSYGKMRNEMGIKF